ncbi:hypothetical protein H5392_02785 [Tessaracoccus sp. MC1865]|uniref:hypothetical protein n=1 Tax=Tessaracoccus sp. MC1865 TaxID=2760310 RepID=UPI0016045B5E|nr:hypothetical protein [Tessaracoccus sp. MC1865]MBB1482787.1 hypothetical protein [Tessaracoccus sp. MC1865]QTO37767.1 hypothetical protein J7D54_01305 [Tessaracoccus sp. MC1865]
MRAQTPQHSLPEEIQVLSLPLPRRVTVVFDESTSPYLMVGAALFESTYEETERRIAELYARTRDLYYLDDLESFELHKSNSFHASEDPREAYTFFVDLLAGLMPLRICILFTRGERRPDLGEVQTLAVLYRELIRTVLQSVRSADEVHLIFETHQSLNSKFAAIVGSASKSVSGRYTLTTSVGQKRKPHALAVADYAMHIFNRWNAAGRPTDPKNHEYRNWKAIRRSISMVRSLEDGTIIRRGLP